MKDDDRMVLKRRFERIYIMMEVKSCTKHEESREKKRNMFMDSNILKQIKSTIIH